MALDTLDFGVMVALAIAIVAYFLKDKIWPQADLDSGFLNSDGLGGSRDLLETLEKNAKNAVVFFGSQTGTAEDYASKLSKELSSRFGLKVLIADFADYDLENFGDIKSDVLTFFLLATYGEGEPTDNAVTFYEWLENEADTLSTLKYTVFGLGNSTYEFYNKIGKDVDIKLEEKGGERFAEYGEGDDGKGTLDEDFLAWKDAVMESLKNNLGMDESEMKYEPTLELIENDFLTVEDNSVALGEPNKTYINSSADLTKGPFDHSHPYLSPITLAKELFQSKERSCVHAEFDLSGSNLKYSTGDHLAIWPSNSNENFDRFVKALGLEKKLNTVFELKKLDSTVHIAFPTPITFGAVIRHHLEISGAISRQLLSSIAPFAPDEETKAATIEIGGNKAEFATKIIQKKFNFADALLFLSQGTPWTNVPFEFIIESIPHLQPRYYSISSSSSSEKTSISITAVVEAENEGDQLITGVVTNLLKNIEISKNKTSEKPFVTYDLKGPRNKFSNYKLPIHVRRSTFKLPSSSTVPIICIGPGTGVAPFRGFVRERVQQKKNGVNVGKTALFYGCRNEAEDFLYKEEWPEYAKSLGSNFEIHTAFSRHDPSKKVYVQHKLLEQSAKIIELINEGAFIYVCGDASRMARDVQSTLIKILAESKDISEEKATELVRSYKIQNRYQEDVW